MYVGGDSVSSRIAKAIKVNDLTDFKRALSTKSLYKNVPDSISKQFTPAHFDINDFMYNCECMTLLGYACYYQRLEMIKILVKEPGIDVNKGERYQFSRNMDEYEDPYSHYILETPLLIACSKGNIEIVSFLIGLPKIDVNAGKFNSKNRKENQTPLGLAIKMKSCEIVKMLLTCNGIRIRRRYLRGIQELIPSENSINPVNEEQDPDISNNRNE